MVKSEYLASVFKIQGKLLQADGKELQLIFCFFSDFLPKAEGEWLKYIWAFLLEIMY